MLINKKLHFDEATVNDKVAFFKKQMWVGQKRPQEKMNKEWKKDDLKFFAFKLICIATFNCCDILKISENNNNNNSSSSNDDKNSSDQADSGINCVDVVIVIIVVIVNSNCDRISDSD